MSARVSAPGDVGNGTLHSVLSPAGGSVTLGAAAAAGTGCSGNKTLQSVAWAAGGVAAPAACGAALGEDTGEGDSSAAVAATAGVRSLAARACSSAAADLKNITGTRRSRASQATCGTLSAATGAAAGRCVSLPAAAPEGCVAIAAAVCSPAGERRASVAATQPLAGPLFADGAGAAA